MFRFCLEVYLENDLIFNMEFRSLTSVAKCIDRFSNCEKNNIWFELFDCIKGQSINVKELMRIWHV